MSKNLKDLLFYIGLMLGFASYRSITSSISTTLTSTDCVIYIILCIILGIIFSFTWIGDILQSFKKWWRE